MHYYYRKALHTLHNNRQLLHLPPLPAMEQLNETTGSFHRQLQPAADVVSEQQRSEERIDRLAGDRVRYAWRTALFACFFKGHG